jgi:uncharacterized protein (TIGR03083 family)
MGVEVIAFADAAVWEWLAVGRWDAAGLLVEWRRGRPASMEAMTPASDHSVEIAVLFATERARLLDLLASVADEEWRQPSPCPEWTVLGLCCHLVGDDFSLLSRHRDGYHGTPAPDGLAEAELIAWIDNLQIEWVHAARRLSPRLVVDLLDWAGPQLVEVFEQQDPDALVARVSWAGPDPVPVWLDQVRELSEYWIHRQQLLQALGRTSDLRPDLLGPILDGLRWAYPHRLAAIPAQPGDFVSIEITGPVAASWHLVATGSAWTFRAEPDSHRVASLSMTTDQAWRLLTNNLPADQHPRLQLSGDEQITDALRRTRAIIGSPK